MGPSERTPGWRRISFANVWFVIIMTTCRLEISSRMFCDSGSEKGPVPRYVSTVGLELVPGPPQRSP